MDQARLKIDEILQNHNIAFNKAPANTLQLAIQQRVNLSSKIRNFPGNSRAVTPSDNADLS